MIKVRGRRGLVRRVVLCGRIDGFPNGRMDVKSIMCICIIESEMGCYGDGIGWVGTSGRARAPTFSIAIVYERKIHWVSQKLSTE